MGIVSSQSFKNTITTYLGFGIGAINTLFLYVKFLTPEYYGLVAYILSTATIMMPLMAFGVQNALVKFYSGYKSKSTQNSFLTYMLLLPLIIIIPVAITGLFAYEYIAEFLSRENDIVYEYLWHIVFTAIAMAYFEVFYAWSKVQMKTVFGNFFKEVFHRACLSILLVSLAFDLLSMDTFILSIVFIYVIRMFIMMIYAFSLRKPAIRFDSVNNRFDLFKYAILIILAGSIATIILDIDKFMIAQYLPIENVAFYSVAIYIATVIAVPQRAMHQILMPLTAKFLSERDFESLSDLYLKSSLTLLIIGGLIFLLVVLNVNELYRIIPEEYAGGLLIVLVISTAKLYDNLMGNNNAILFNSDYYRMVLVFGVLLALMAIILNAILIPIYGINGSAIATLIAIIVYNTIKLIFVKRKFNMQPITIKSLKVVIIISAMFLMFYFWDLELNVYLNIAIKSTIIAALYLITIYKLKLSVDINEAVDKFLKLKK